jgi:hypothetical protein
MESIKLFGAFLNESFVVFRKEFRTYLNSFIALVFIGFLASFPWEGMGFEANSFYEIINGVFVGILSLIVLVNVILIEKAKFKGSDKEQLLYATPTYLIYTLYTSLIMLAGFFCFIIPGIILGICFAMVPLASVLIDNDDVNYFKLSYRMARIEPWPIICFGVLTILIELPSFAFDLIPNWQIKLLLNILYSFIDSVLMIVLTLTSVKVFYYLKKKLRDHSA